ncbi:MAG: LysR family transcriptional regulator [Lactobacillus sp.]|nr:LysR family transcriptional regulator [Lactobacillus sp.]
MNDQLTTFISVAENKSFNKAANQLFISAPAVIKQINALEKKIHVTLFNRTHSGVSLTPAGESFYQDAKKLVAAYTKSINHAQDLAEEKQSVKIGVGPLATGTGVNNLWLKISQKYPNITFQFIPCSCALGSFNEFLAGINKEFDLVSSVYDTNLLQMFGLKATELDITPLKISVPVQNPLSNKEDLTLNDLKGQTIALSPRGEFNCFDQVRDMLEKDPTITIKDINGFDMPILNSCVENNWLLCSAEDWQTAHPMLKAKTVDWDFTASFGLVYGEKHSQVVDQIVDFVNNDYQR